ncbi:MAG TPA: selenide, water dikinase SelD [Gaiellaceae bacterium]|nr:selenide, water dikinase SelD [Gaiellaceae bacterium]
MTETASLTSLSVGGGCAAKYSAARLEELLRGFVPAEAEDLLVGLDPADDAAVYRLDGERALVFTVDFFPPLVDDPELFGRIAATNALNDVFAMGGTPLLALSIAAFPEELPTEVVRAVFDGAEAQVRGAGALLAGGHTIRDSEPKYGLAVVGTVHPDGVWRKDAARPGDAVFLTKPLGTGLVLAGKTNLDEATRWMTVLNGQAAEVLRPFEPNAVTDVTGFGLLGHAHETAQRSGVRIVLDARALPALPGALEAARSGIRTGGDPRNREFAGPHVESDGVPDDLLSLAYDAQTAGGLLVTLPAEKALSVEAEFRRADLFLARIGAVEEGAGVALVS